MIPASTSQKILHRLDQNDQKIAVLQQAAAYFEQHGMRTEGLFRVSGNQALIAELRQQYDDGESPSCPGPIPPLG